MACTHLDIDAELEEGNYVVAVYDLKDENGDDITHVDSLKYCVSDGKNKIEDWTEVVDPDLPSGEIIISGSTNVIDKYKDRYIRIHANYDIGRKDVFKTIRYQLLRSPYII